MQKAEINVSLIVQGPPKPKVYEYPMDSLLIVADIITTAATTFTPT